MPAWHFEPVFISDMHTHMYRVMNYSSHVAIGMNMRKVGSALLQLPATFRIANMYDVI